MKKNFTVLLKFLFSWDKEWILHKLIYKPPLKKISSKALKYANFKLLLVNNLLGEIDFISNLNESIFSFIELIKCSGQFATKSKISLSLFFILKLVFCKNSNKLLYWKLSLYFWKNSSLNK